MVQESGKPQRICVIGCGGTGKSTLARLLGDRMDLPVFHLDALIWQAGWVLPSREDIIAAQKGNSDGERWVIDGNWDSTMPVRLARADTIIWLDYPTRTALWGIMKRLAHWRGRGRPDMAEGCVERFDWEFLRWVVEFRSKHRQRIPEKIREHGSHARLFQITRRSELPAVLDELLNAASTTLHEHPMRCA